MWKKLQNKIAQFGREGLFHIFGSSVLAKVGGLISSVVVVRGLPKAEYGGFVDADNLYAYFAVFIGLGLANAVVQFCSERISEARRCAIYRYSMAAGMAGNALLAVLILALSALRWYAGAREVGLYLGMMCLLPFAAYVDQYLQIVLRVQLRNKDFSVTNVLYTVFHVGGNIVFTRLWGVPGLVLSQYLGHLVAALRSALVLRRDGFFVHLRAGTLALEQADKREFLTYGLTCTLTNFASTVLVLLDVTCLGLVLGDAEILADYKVAATIPTACGFVPSCLIIYFYPKLVSAIGESKAAFRRVLGQMARLSALVNGAVCLGLLVLAPVVIGLVFGGKYANVTPIFRILSLNYLIFSVRSLTGNAITVMKRVKVNLAFAVASGLVHIPLNLVLIPRLGSPGAAISTLSVTCLMVVLNLVFLARALREP